jgi:hypothetical protein
MDIIISAITVVVAYILKPMQGIGAWMDKPPTNGDLLFAVGFACWFIYVAIKAMLGNVLVEIASLKRHN